MTPSLPERVASLEATLPPIQAGFVTLIRVQEHQESTLNTICVNVATLTANVRVLMEDKATKEEYACEEYSRWKDPMLYVTLLSVAIAAYAVVAH